MCLSVCVCEEHSSKEDELVNRLLSREGLQIISCGLTIYRIPSRFSEPLSPTCPFVCVEAGSGGVHGRPKNKTKWVLFSLKVQDEKDQQFAFFTTRGSTTTSVRAPALKVTHQLGSSRRGCAHKQRRKKKKKTTTLKACAQLECM